MRVYVPLIPEEGKTCQEELARQVENGLLHVVHDPPGCRFAELDIQLIRIEEKYDYERLPQEDQIPE